MGAWGNVCGILSPDGKLACTLMDGHVKHGVPTCKNPFNQSSWCGFCGDWTCRIPGVEVEKSFYEEQGKGTSQKEVP